MEIKIHKPMSIKPTSQIIECVQQFQLPQQISNTTTQQQSSIMTRKNKNIQFSVFPSSLSNDTKMLTNMQYSLLSKKLRILSRNGKDLGEFNIKLRQDDSTKEQVITITKSKKTESVKPLMITLSPVPLDVQEKTFLSIQKSDPTIVANKQEEVKSYNDNSQTQIETQYKIDSRSEVEKVTISNRPTDNEVPSIATNVIYKRIADSSFPIVSCKKLKINYMNDKYKQTCFKIHKRDYIATAEKKENKNVTFSDRTNSEKGYNEDNVYLNQKSINNYVKENANSIYKSNHMLAKKGHRNIMTIIPNNNSISFNENAASAETSVEHNIVSSASNNKVMHDINHVNLKNGFKYDDLSPNNDTQVTSKLEKIIDNFHINKQLDDEDKNCSKNLCQKDLSDQWNIIKKAVYSVNDKNLREQALKALSDCCIGIKKYVPKRPLEELKAVHDTQVQTMVFGLIEPKSFVLVNENIENIQKIPQINAQNTFNIKDVLLEKDLFDNDFVSINADMNVKANDFDIDSFLSQICKESPGAQQVKETLSVTHTKSKRILEQLQKDFEFIKTYDNNGMLSIHNAVIKNNVFDVRRYLMIFKQCKENIDILTMNGMTSLELAIKYDICSEIVECLLKAGAQPVISKLTHESALIIAAKQSSKLLPILIKHVLNSKLLDQIDSEGFAALHYCCKYGNLKGVDALISAGANINLKDMKSGRTPLFHASDNDHSVVIQRLVQTGAIVNIPNFAGHTPLMMGKDLKITSFPNL